MINVPDHIKLNSHEYWEKLLWDFQTLKTDLVVARANTDVQYFEPIILKDFDAYKDFLKESLLSIEQCAHDLKPFLSEPLENKFSILLSDPHNFIRVTSEYVFDAYCIAITACDLYVKIQSSSPPLDDNPHKVYQLKKDALEALELSKAKPTIDNVAFMYRKYEPKPFGINIPKFLSWILRPA